MISIKNNILKDLEACVNVGNKNKTTDSKSSSFNKVLDKNISDKKDNDVKNPVFNKEKSASYVEKDQELEEEVLLEKGTNKLNKKSINDIIEIILSMMNQNGNSEVCIEDIKCFAKENIEQIENIMNLINSTDLKDPSALKDMYVKLQDIIKVVEFKDTIYKEDMIKDVSNRIKEYVLDIPSEEGITKNNEPNKVNNSKQEVDMIQQLIGKIKENVNKKSESDSQFSNSNNSSEKSAFVSNNSKIENKESSFLESLAQDDLTNEEISLDKINFHLNKMQNLDKIENKFLKDNIGTNMKVSKETFDFDIVKSIKLMDSTNMKELTLKIVPRELGELIIKVSMDNGILKANITSNTKEGYELLQSNSKIILEKLQSESIKIQEFSVDIYDQNNTASNDHNFSDKRGEYDEKFNSNTKHVDGIEAENIDEDKIRESMMDDVINMLA